MLPVPKPTPAPAEADLGLSGASALMAFLEAAPDALVVVDARGAITIVNGLTERMFGFSREELIGQSIEILVPDRSGRRKDGTQFPVEISLAPLQTESGLFVSAAIRDISERKLVEDKLRTSLQEKEVLLKEIHHRVKNNLQIVSSMLNLQMDQLEDERARSLFQESQSRVRSIAMFHETLYQSKDLAHVDMGEYVTNLGKGLFATWGVRPGTVGLEVDAEDVPLGVDAALACGLIVNELVTNSLKHAFPDGRRGTIAISLHANESGITLEVRDDGAGFPAHLDLQRPSSLGLRLVDILTRQVRGTLHLDRSHGTRFVICFPRGDHE